MATERVAAIYERFIRALPPAERLALVQMVAGDLAAELGSAETQTGSGGAQEQREAIPAGAEALARAGRPRDEWDRRLPRDSWET